MAKIQLQITRSKWGRKTFEQYLDGTDEVSHLFDNSEKMCCMGFDCSLIHHIPDYRLLNAGYPADIGLNHLEINIKNAFSSFKRTTFLSDMLSDLLARVNDRSGVGNFTWVNKISDEEQEEIIIRLYSLVNYEVTFVD